MLNREILLFIPNRNNPSMAAVASYSTKVIINSHKK